MVGNEVFFGWQLPTATVTVWAKNGTAARMSQDARIHLAIRMCSSPESNVMMQGPDKASARGKAEKSVCQGDARSVKAIKIKCANPCADCVFTQSADPVNTIRGWKSVPAIRVAMAIRSLWPQKTFTWGARDISGRFTARPLRMRAALSSLAVMLGNCGTNFLGWTKKDSALPCCIAASNAGNEWASSIANSATEVRRREAR